MLTPNYLLNAPEEVVKMFTELEERVLCDIAERIRGNKFNMTSTADYQLLKLKELGVATAEIQKYIAETLNITESKVSEIIKNSSYKSVEYDNEIFKDAYEEGVTSSFNPNKLNLTNLILDGINSTNTEISNICKSMVNAANTSYINALDQAYLSVSSGAFSYDSAVKSAVESIGKNGLKWIDYESGTHRRVDSAIRNALRTGINQTACRCQDKNFDEMGGNLVETTSHMGARPSHALWQGMIFWKKYPVDGYKEFKKSTGYGTGAGLGGWNCRHNYFPYFEGLSSPSFKHFDENENAKQYELEQEQRYNERMIREWKRRMNVNISGGVDNTKEATKYREWKARQDKLLKAHPGLKRNYSRESVTENKGILKEYYAMNNKNVKIKVTNSEREIVNKSYESAYVYDRKGNLLFKKSGKEHEVAFTQKELAMMKDAIVSHNHPRNTTFSPEDIYMLKDWNLQELRVVTDKGTYVLKRNENIHLMPKCDDLKKEHYDLYKKYQSVYMNKFPNWNKDKGRMDRVIQNNIMNNFSKKYGFLYLLEEIK